jgi:hypothetical protein
MTAGNNGLGCGGNKVFVEAHQFFAVVFFRFSVLHHSNADPDPSFHLNAEPDGTFHYNADPDPDLQTLDGSILVLHASILSAQTPPWFHFEPLNLLNFDFFADPRGVQK